MEYVKVLTGVDLNDRVKAKMDLLSSKICSGNQFPTDNPMIRCFKLLCGLLNDSWKHYICFHPEKPATPQPTVAVEDDHMKIYLDWTFICCSYSIEQSLAVLIGLYCLMNLKFHAYRAALRFLYVYFFNDKQQQSNNIRRFCKEYNIEIQEKSPPSPAELRETEDNDALHTHESEYGDDASTTISEEQSHEKICDEVQISTPIPLQTIQEATNKRKAEHIIDPQDADEENTPPRKQTCRSTRQKRRSK